MILNRSVYFKVGHYFRMLQTSAQTNDDGRQHDVRTCNGNHHCRNRQTIQLDQRGEGNRCEGLQEQDGIQELEQGLGQDGILVQGLGQQGECKCFGEQGLGDILVQGQELDDIQEQEREHEQLVICFKQQFRNGDGRRHGGQSCNGNHHQRVQQMEQREECKCFEEQLEQELGQGGILVQGQGQQGECKCFGELGQGGIRELERELGLDDILVLEQGQQGECRCFGEQGQGGILVLEQGQELGGILVLELGQQGEYY
ncbi:hypothetical protein FF38_05093 [Lucilia cuprina]|uniref:Uncharacterized protein n=1 Tax=Lucilia cuprina TaxID=7375 RepID=A0A0L0C5C1_LUCCU|nr:hypothetical protein FF38_05093 [Lucilia cuprina]